ncbi:MAG: cytochrome C oxidase subunit IV family protein [Acidobacteria bacterium]|nr:cytochrome C oxidase subunit IV family protein [Acidobacteriota bacterium]
MVDLHAGDMRHHVRLYVRVFVALLVLTAVTVAASYLHLAVPIAVTIALIIAAAKGSLVASFFMHLITERRVVFGALVLTVVFFLVLMFLPLFTQWDTIGQKVQ